MLFSDIEGSLLLSRLGVRYAEALDSQRSVLRRAWSAWGGVEMGTEGDSFFVVFGVAGDGVRAALHAQRDLASQQWPADEELRVRIGVHTGEPVLHGDGYVGIDVVRAARLSAAAHGGQLLVTAATWQLVADSMPRDAIVSDLGWHRFKDFADSVHVYQLGWHGLLESFPPLRSLGRASGLPVEHTALVGRSEEIAALTALLARPGVSLVTLSGTGGSGKTRLAVAVAGAMADSTPGGVFFVPLAGVSRAEEVFASLFETFVAPGATPSTPALFAELAQRRPMLVLDNLEQIPDVDTVVAELMAEVPGLAIVVTSRRPLHVVGEHEYLVAPLSLPGDDLAAISGSSAVEMFCQHAKMVRSDFCLTSENAADVAAICRRLDGLPLALELAAARTRLLSPAGVMARLTSSAGLSAPASGRPDRHQALADTIAWSYDLLSPQLRKVFRHLGIFVGGADLDAVTAVAMVDCNLDPLDAMTDLVDASLVVTPGDADAEPRLTVLQTVADFAVERLADADELDAAQARHAAHYLTVARRWDAQIFSGRRAEALQRLLAERDNFRSALTWAVRPDGERPPHDAARLGLRLCESLYWFWHFCGSAGEGLRWCERALAVDSGDDSYERALVLCHAADEMDVPPDDPGRVALVEDALAMARRIDDPGAISFVLISLVEAQLANGDLDTAQAMLDEAESLAHESGSWVSRAFALVRQADLVGLRGLDVSRSIALCEEMERLAQERGDENGVVWAESLIAEHLSRVGRGTDALVRLRASAAGVRRMSNRSLMIRTLGCFAIAFATAEDAERAAILLGAHWSASTAVGGLIDVAAEEPWLQNSGLAAARDSAVRADWDHWLAVGAALEPDEALDVALSE